jgi:hypothetical protein
VTRRSEHPQNLRLKIQQNRTEVSGNGFEGETSGVPQPLEFITERLWKSSARASQHDKNVTLAINLLSLAANCL